MVEMTRDEWNINVARFANRLAVVERLQHCQAPRVLLHLPGERVEITRTRMTAERLPCRQRCARSIDGRVNIRRIRLRYARQLLARGGIQRLEVLTARRLAPPAADEVTKLAPMPIEPRQGLFRIFRRRTILHRVKLLNYRCAHNSSFSERQMVQVSLGGVVRVLMYARKKSRIIRIDIAKPTKNGSIGPPSIKNFSVPYRAEPA